MNILQWLAGDGVGQSSKAIALTALGEMPPRADYPRDGDDFGRCVRLLAICPEAKAGLTKLGTDGPPEWRALVLRWAEIEEAWLHDMGIWERGIRDHKQFKCYDLMRSIYDPVRDNPSHGASE